MDDETKVAHVMAVIKNKDGEEIGRATRSRTVQVGEDPSLALLSVIDEIGNIFRYSKPCTITGRGTDDIVHYLGAEEYQKLDDFTIHFKHVITNKY